ncbi:MAG: metallophosphoesterase [Deltaproteobacteria bacterium]|nr:metallophosphoesterase [Deltaproteobacteria bacterium]
MKHIGKKSARRAVLCVATALLVNLASATVFATPALGSGDINDDGVVTVDVDVQAVYEFVYQGIQLSEAQLAAADVDLDGDVDNDDLEHIYFYTSGAVRALPVKNRLFLTADVHETQGVTNFSNVMQNTYWSYTVPEVMSQVIFGGDYDNTLTDVSADIEQECNDAVQQIYPDINPYMAQGNHDQKTQDPDNPGAPYPYNKGLVVDPANSNYGVYIMDIDAADIWNIDFRQTDIDHLARLLDYVPSYVPFVIVSHIPIHSFKASYVVREYPHAEALIDVLNGHHNVIFLYGHNHSQKDPMYFNPLYGGGTIPYNYVSDTQSDTANIDFSYLTMGAAKDGGNDTSPDGVYAVRISLDKIRTGAYYDSSDVHINSYDVDGDIQNSATIHIDYSGAYVQ